MLKLRNEGKTVIIETASADFKWDSARGGQITELVVKDELFSHPLLSNGNIVPDLQFVVDGRPVRQSDSTGKLEVLKESPDRILMRNSAMVGDGAFEVEQLYEVFPEGVVFCEMSIGVPSGKSLDLSDCSLNIAIDTKTAKNVRWGHYTREPGYKRDATTVHAFGDHRLFRKPEECADVRQLYPMVSLDVGWEATRFFSNHLEFVMEDWTSFNDQALSNTRTRVGKEGDTWGLHWHFHEGSTLAVSGPCRYRNRWAVTVGMARTRSGMDADLAMRNNALGCRLAHCMYPYARLGDEWPWAVMPIKQVSAQPPQLFKGVPDPSRANEAAECGANMMILHQFWMKNPGSNNEPVADYQPLDQAWLKSFVDRCHDVGMKVLLYVRGTEMWQLYSSFFEDFMKKDYDGVYADWATPLAMGYVKTSPLHFSAYNFFLFSRAMRKRVGPGGLMIGHTGNATYLASASYDVALGGEFSVRHDELLANPESSSYYSLLNCCGGHLISGNLPDREAFSSRKAMSVCAAFGMTGHPFMEPDDHFSKPLAYIKPLWDCMGQLSGNVVRLHNPVYSPTRAIRSDSEQLYPSLFQSDNGKALLLVTNLDSQAASGTVEVDLRELDVPASATVTPLNVEGVASCEVSGSSVIAKDMDSMYFSAALIE